MARLLCPRGKNQIGRLCLVPLQQQKRRRLRNVHFQHSMASRARVWLGHVGVTCTAQFSVRHFSKCLVEAAAVEVSIYADVRAQQCHYDDVIAIRPRTAIGGGSFWNYNGGLSSGSSVFDAVISTINSRLSSRGITTCSCATATDIGCVQNSYCGKIWCPDGGK